MADVSFVHSEKDLIFVDNRRVGSIRTKNDGNVLTNINIDEEERGNGYARDAMESWAEKCDREGFEYAYVANVNHKATSHIMKTFQGYETTEVSPRKVPADVKPGIHISDICYEIDLNS